MRFVRSGISALVAGRLLTSLKGLRLVSVLIFLGVVTLPGDIATQMLG